MDSDTGSLLTDKEVVTLLERDPARWNGMLGASVSHTHFGEGQIAGVESKPKRLTSLSIIFPDPVGTKIFISDKFGGGVISFAGIPDSILSECGRWKNELEEEQKRQAEEEARLAREERERKAARAQRVEIAERARAIADDEARAQRQQQRAKADDEARAQRQQQRAKADDEARAQRQQQRAKADDEARARQRRQRATEIDSLRQRISARQKASIEAMQRIVAERSIRRLVHFTRIENLSGILKLGILPRHAMTELPFLSCDDVRVDGYDEASCVSIEFPNYRMFYRYRFLAKEANWAVIQFPSILLIEKPCLFFPSNAASSRFRQVSKESLCAADGLNAMYGESPEGLRAKLGLSKEYPTDPQAEVLIFDVIEPKFFEEIHVLRDEGMTSEITKYLPHAKVHIGGPMFKPRSDWQHWKVKAVGDSSAIWDDIPF